MRRFAGFGESAVGDTAPEQCGAELDFRTAQEQWHTVPILARRVASMLPEH